MKQQKTITMMTKNSKSSSNKCGKCVGDDGCVKTKKTSSKHGEECGKDSDKE